MTLDDIKRDLRVTHDDDDALLEVLIASAKDQAMRFIDQDELPTVPVDSSSSSSSSSSIGSLEYPGSIRTALILLVRCLYDPADAKEIEATRKAAETMLMPYRNGLGA